MPEPSLSQSHWVLAGFRQRVTAKELKALLLAGHDTIIRAGHLCDIKRKSLGCGVYDIWFEKRNYGSPSRNGTGEVGEGKGENR